MKKPLFYLLFFINLIVLFITGTASESYAQCQYKSGNTVYADIVVIDLPIHYNRFGVLQPQGLIYALKSDVYKPSKQFTLDSRQAAIYELID